MPDLGWQTRKGKGSGFQIATGLSLASRTRKLKAIQTRMGIN